MNDDVTRCHGGACPWKRSCVRFLQDKNTLQYHFIEAPFNEEGCSYFIDKDGGFVRASIEERKIRIKEISGSESQYSMPEMQKDICCRDDP